MLWRTPYLGIFRFSSATQRLPRRLRAITRSVVAASGLPRSRAAHAQTAKSATDSLKNEFETADGLLEERLDKLVVQFKSSASAFLTACQAARETTANAATREAKTRTDDPPTPPAPATSQVFRLARWATQLQFAMVNGRRSSLRLPPWVFAKNSTAWTRFF